jgi:hypothetical protein
LPITCGCSNYVETSEVQTAKYAKQGKNRIYGIAHVTIFYVTLDNDIKQAKSNPKSSALELPTLDSFFG